MPRASLTLPPPQFNSDAPLDTDFLYRWSLNNTPNGTPAATAAHRSPSFPRRQASFDSPREIPLPSSASISAVSPLMPNSPGVTLTTPHSTRRLDLSPRVRDPSPDYFSSRPRFRSSSLTPHDGPSSSAASPYLPPSDPILHSPKFKPKPHPNDRDTDDDDSSSSGGARSGSSSNSTTQTSPSPPLARQLSHSPYHSEINAFMMGDRSLPTTPAPCSDLQNPNSLRSSLPPHPESALGTSPNLMMTSFSSPPHGLISNPPVLAPTPSRHSNHPSSSLSLSRPYHLPHSSMPGSDSSRTSTISSPTPHPSGAKPSSPGGWPDRSASTSLPLPRQIPYHVLPRAGFSTVGATLEEAMTQSWDINAGVAHAELVRTMHEIEVGRRLHKPEWGRDENHRLRCSSSSCLSREESPTSPSRRTQQRALSPLPAQQQHQHQILSSSNSAQAASGLHCHRFPSPSASPSPSQGQDTQDSVAVSFPAPQPPIVLAPEESSGPFTSHSAPPNTWIRTEVTPTEYKLIIHLPGFSMDGITLATKRMRVLHVVADSWENGGHFDRKIEFGWDADIQRVRAEFDGQTLKCKIPRLAPSVELRAPRLGPVGRSG